PCARAKRREGLSSGKRTRWRASPAAVPSSRTTNSASSL
ncbi:MAG: hypothetical protein AVDCRST_MAG93-3221, partial [uncultured Chloroflexia bacterium]